MAAYVHDSQFFTRRTVVLFAIVALHILIAWALATGLARRAIELVGHERVVLTPDCGFATFADNPVASAPVAEAKLRAIADAAAELRGRKLE